MAAVKEFRSGASGLADYLPYAAYIDDGIILNKDGTLMAAWALRGPDLSSSTHAERNFLSSRMNALLSRLGSGFMFHVDAVRTASSRYPSPDRSFFPDPVSRMIDDERQKAFESDQSHFETSLILTVTFTPPSLATTRLSSAMYTEDDADGKKSAADEALVAFKEFLTEFEDLISNIMHARRLASTARQDEFGATHHPDDFLRHIQHCITGRNHPVNLPPVPMYLDAILASEFRSGIMPMVGDHYIGVVAIDGFPQESFPGILSELDKMPMEYRWSTRFIFLDSFDAKSRLEAYRRKWQQRTRSLIDQIFQTESKAVDADALRMVNDTETALSEASSQVVAFGYLSFNIIVYHTNPSQLDKLLAYTRRVINNAGFNGRIETVNTVEAYIGSLPGSGYANIRAPLLNSLNLADLLPLNSIWAGREYSPCPMYPPQSPPLMLVASSGSTPFRLNLYVQDVGHTLIFGPTGSGKSTLLALIAAQFRRYKGSQIFCFDKGRSMLPLTLGCGGQHYDVGSDDSALFFCPLARLETDFDQSWAEDWLAAILMLQGVTITPAIRNELHRAIGVLRNSEAERTISNLISTLQDKPLRAALQYYSITGALGPLLDSESDTLVESNFVTFELEELMDMGKAALMPVLLYLFNRIERRLKGAPSLIILDEAWLMLGHDAFREKIRTWLKVLRKANCAVVLATQSLSDASRSGIIDVLNESCPTKIFLPNIEARHEASQELYLSLGLNDRQIEIIASAAPKRDYYAVSPEGRRLFEMNLGPATLSFVGASAAEDIARVKELHKQHGDQWVEPWLQQRGVRHDQALH